MSASSAIQEFADFVVANKNWDDDLAIRHLVATHISKSMAEDTVRFAPIAFGRLLLAPLGVELTNQYICFQADGTAARSGELDQNDVFNLATHLADGFALHPAFRSLAYSSSEVDGVNQALKAGSDPKDLVLGPIAIFLESPTKSGFQIAQNRILQLAREAANIEPEPEKSRATKPWWKFW